MNRAWRCEARDANGNRCQHKTGHEKAEKPTRHLSFGRVWDGPVTLEDHVDAVAKAIAAELAPGADELHSEPGHVPWSSILGEKPPRRTMPDGSPCWCMADVEPHDGWVHSPVCQTIRDRRMPEVEPVPVPVKGVF